MPPWGYGPLPLGLRRGDLGVLASQNDSPDAKKTSLCQPMLTVGVTQPDQVFPAGHRVVPAHVSLASHAQPLPKLHRKTSAARPPNRRLINQHHHRKYITMGKVHGSLARAGAFMLLSAHIKDGILINFPGKVKSQTPKVRRRNPNPPPPEPLDD